MGWYYDRTSWAPGHTLRSGPYSSRVFAEAVKMCDHDALVDRNVYMIPDDSSGKEGTRTEQGLSEPDNRSEENWERKSKS